MAARRRSFGSVRRLPSRRWQARYTGPDQNTHTAPLTFDTKGDAEAWLALRQSEILRDTWLPPGTPQSAPVTLGQYATTWLATRPLKPRTRAHYSDLLTRWILPTFGDSRMSAVTPATVRSWHAALTVGPTSKAHAYGLLRTIMATAVSDDLITANPCRIRGAGSTERVKTIRPATLAELETIVAELPARYQVMTLLAAWCGLRFGELAELRRRDVDLEHGVVHIRRAVVARKEIGVVIGKPKSAAGVRDVA
ncbi:MAG: tyrosine-type recombinase/integrase, partial [Actinomycetes bacterium]